MPRTTIYSLALIALLIVVFLFNRGDVDVNLVFTEISMMKSMAFLLFTGMGVLIGVMLK